jgi:hypothetical protein
MNRDHFASPHQGRHDARLRGKTGRVQPMPALYAHNRHAKLLARLAGMVGMCAGGSLLAMMLFRVIAASL